MFSRFSLSKRLAFLLFILFIVLVGSGVLVARGSVPLTTADADWPSISLEAVATGLEYPVYLTHAGDGSGRIFVVEKAGRIKILDSGSGDPVTFLDITDRVEAEAFEQGLLSVAFPPDYADAGYFYVDYTDLEGDTVVARYRVTSDPDVADPDSERIVLAVEQPNEVHNGGMLAFGPKDGCLYVGLGDGGPQGDPEGHAQNPGTLLGKILRIDVGSPITSPTETLTETVYLPLVRTPEGVIGYGIPPTNPYTQTAGYRPEIWALGFRNPWRFSFDRATGDLYIGDVGFESFEELNFQPASSPGGENYGWNIMEGKHCHPLNESCDEAGLTLPIFEYGHVNGQCAITGGYVYRGSADPDLEGVYLFGDFCSGHLWGARREGDDWLFREYGALESVFISSFGEDEAGNVYVLGYSAGNVFKIVNP